MNQDTLHPSPALRRSWPYTPNPAYYDEMLDGAGRVRPQWKELAGPLEQMGAAGFEQRWREGRRFLHENGTTYNVYSDPQNADRPWPMDPIPLLLDAGEWAGIERAVVQRARLLNAILADLYGAQALLRDGLVPPELVLPNPAFLRPCVNVPVPGGVYLHVCAFDLARSANGQWWVIGNRTQAPSGAGYALENRLVSTRVMPDIFRAANAQRLASFFQTYRETLHALAPGRRENPRIVLLTPGPYNETYFEHAFLARYLGYTLVEGGDLTVRDSRVYLKTLGGLLPVDLIVRRQDDNYCDPLELREDSMLGVPGLMQAVRSGSVTVANALGSGLGESAAPGGFLPGLCRHILGEELAMPSVATWWCGEPAALEEVAGKLTSVVIKPAFPTPGRHPMFPARMSKSERAALLDRIRAAPRNYVAQEQVGLSTVPVWEDGKLQPRHLVLRVYAVAASGGYAVMPGGLTRYTTSLDEFVASMQAGGGSKDTWVAGAEPSPQLSLLPSASARLNISRATFDLPSRVADNLFWLGRYVERLEPAVRVARAVLPRLALDSDPRAVHGVQTGMRILAGGGFLASRDRIAPPELEVMRLIYGREEPNNLPANIRQVRRLGWLLRDRISADTWRILSQLEQHLLSEPVPEPFHITGARAMLDQAVGAIAAFNGMVMEGMTRGDGWRFLDIGRRIERAAQMADLIRHGLGYECASDGGQLEVLLESADSSITYRSRYLTSMQPDLVLDLLLLDEANPRAVAYQLARLREHVEQLPGTKSLIRRPAEARIAISLLTTVQLAEVREFLCEDAKGRRVNLQSLLDKVSTGLWSLSETLTRFYFSQAGPSRQFSVS